MKSNSNLVPSKLKLYNQEPVFHHKLHQNYVLQKFLNMLRLTFVLIIQIKTCQDVMSYYSVFQVYYITHRKMSYKNNNSLMTKELA